MPIIIKPLTDTEIRKAIAKDKPYKLSDGQGLCLIVTATGSKYFRFDYVFEKKRKSTSFGVYPTISLSKARELREIWKKQLKEGINPLDEKYKDKSVKTFLMVANEWFEVMKNEWKEVTYNKAKGTLLHNTQKLLKRDIKNITRIDILNIIKDMELRGVVETADRVLTNLNRIYKYAVVYNYVEHNIIADIDKKVLKKVKRINLPALTEKSDIKQLLEDVKSYKENFRADISAVYALELAPYVFLRPFNLRALEWSEINLEEKILHIPGEKMKTKLDFTAPLSNQALEIILKIKPYSYEKSKYVFPSPTSNLKPLSDATLNHALARLGYKDKHTTHGFRSTFSTTAHEKIKEHGFNSDIIESCLAHIEKNKVKAAYNRESKFKYFEEKKELIQWYADWLDNL
jgi:integrase